MAARFRFRLEGLLRLRKSLREEAQRHLARKVLERQAVEGRLQALREDHGQAVGARRTERGAVIDVARLRAIERFLVVTERRISATSEELAQAEARVAEARRALTRRHQEYLMLDRLKERRRLQHAEELFRDELREQDEIAVLRYRFNTRRPPAAETP